MKNYGVLAFLLTLKELKDLGHEDSAWKLIDKMIDRLEGGNRKGTRKHQA